MVDKSYNWQWSLTQVDDGLGVGVKVDRVMVDKSYDWHSLLPRLMMAWL